MNLKSVFGKDETSFFSMYIDYSSIGVQPSDSLDINSNDF